MSKKKQPKKRRKRGPLPVLVILLAGVVSCWTGLVKVDRQIRAVTINQSPPLWESRTQEDTLCVTLLGNRLELDLSPLRVVGEETGALIKTPPAPVRLVLELWDQLEKALDPPPKHSWKKGFL
ncbi:MAG: hypothetical protein HFF11_07025 [Angelakisella sp.]|nr:hypothetical protein [Angelakisella sp.]